MRSRFAQVGFNWFVILFHQRLLQKCVVCCLYEYVNDNQTQTQLPQYISYCYDVMLQFRRMEQPEIRMEPRMERVSGIINL